MSIELQSGPRSDTAAQPIPARVGEPPFARWIAEPFLHLETEGIYNPLTNRSLHAHDAGYAELRAAALGGSPAALALLPAVARERLAADGWVVEQLPGEDLATRYYLKYVQLEAHTACNQACYFCPVSVSPREPYFMPLDFYDRIAAQLAAHAATIEGVSMIHYNEPTMDTRFIEQVAILKRHGLPPAVLTNATGLTPKRVDAIVDLGGLKFLSVNLSTLDRARYAADRVGDHLEIVLRNLEYVKDAPLAESMEIAVLGQGDDDHKRDHAEIADRYAGSRFAVKYYEVMDRAGNVPIGLRPGSSSRRLCGCEQTGSRPLQWVHITPYGKAVLCCQDYAERHVVGDLNQQSLDEILAGPEMARLRRWVYGLEDAPRDFLCRGCVYARTR